MQGGKIGLDGLSGKSYILVRHNAREMKMSQQMTQEQQAEAIRLLRLARGYFRRSSQLRVDMNILLSQLGIKTISEEERANPAA